MPQLKVRKRLQNLHGYGPKMRVDLPEKGKEDGKLEGKFRNGNLLVEPGTEVKHQQAAIACYEIGVFNNLKEGGKNHHR